MSAPSDAGEGHPPTAVKADMKSIVEQPAVKKALDKLVPNGSKLLKSLFKKNENADPSPRLAVAAVRPAPRGNRREPASPASLPSSAPWTSSPPRRKAGPCCAFYRTPSGWNTRTPPAPAISSPSRPGDLPASRLQRLRPGPGLAIARAAYIYKPTPSPA